MFKEGGVNVFLQLKDTSHILTNTLFIAHQITARFYKLREPTGTD